MFYRFVFALRGYSVAENARYSVNKNKEDSSVFFYNSIAQKYYTPSPTFCQTICFRINIIKKIKNRLSRIREPVDNIYGYIHINYTRELYHI